MFIEKGGHTGSGGFTLLFRVGFESGYTLAVLMNAEAGEYALGNATTLSRGIQSIVNGVAPTTYVIGSDRDVRGGLGLGRFVGADGALELAEHESATLLFARGQEVIDKVIGASKSDRDLYRSFNARSSTLIQIARGVARPGSDEKLNHASDLLRKRLSASGGSAVSVLGTVPEWILPSEGLVTFIEYGSQKPRSMRLHWASDGTLKSIGGSVYSNPLIGRLVASSDGPEALFMGLGRLSEPLAGSRGEISIADLNLSRD